MLYSRYFFSFEVTIWRKDFTFKSNPRFFGPCLWHLSNRRHDKIFDTNSNSCLLAWHFNLFYQALTKLCFWRKCRRPGHLHKSGRRLCIFFLAVYMFIICRRVHSDFSLPIPPSAGFFTIWDRLVDTGEGNVAQILQELSTAGERLTHPSTNRLVSKFQSWPLALDE